MNKKLVLIVEDDHALSSALKEALELEGFEALACGNGEKGLALALSRHPDLILLDILMPVMDGITMLANLRKDTWGKNAPVIVLSNLTDQTGMSTTSVSGTFEYLVKSDTKLADVVRHAKDMLNV